MNYSSMWNNSYKEHSIGVRYYIPRENSTKRIFGDSFDEIADSTGFDNFPSIPTSSVETDYSLRKSK